jgi:8-oxo-dGTP pyrophosphatase MutT (NUDIX family)
MHRRHLAQKLMLHTPFDDDERRMLDQTLRFVAEHEDCFERSLKVGHITGSAWIVDLARTHALLTHHRKLGRWLQLGGHCDGDGNILNVALREGAEESGLQTLRPLSESIFDLDVHLIPARKDEPAHYHYDVRYLLEADRHIPLTISEESRELAWVPLQEIGDLAPDASMQRMVAKTLEIMDFNI